MKRFNIILPKEDGGIEIYPMKEWLRQHPEHNPTGLDPTSSTSHQLRDALRKHRWTIQETENEIRLLMPGNLFPPDIDNENSEEDEESETCFALEYQLRDFIAQNISSIPFDGNRLRLYVDPTGRDGIEYPTDTGNIDILAIDEKSNSFVVFELKRARSPDRALGQLARYMGWVKETIGKDKEVRGVIVSKTISNNLKYAALVVPNVTLFEYEVKFNLKAIHNKK